jgi:hypothetical protein
VSQPGAGQMTEAVLGAGEPQPPPRPSPPGGGRPWYRRRAFLVGAVVVAVVAVTVVTDLPQHASRPVQIAGDDTVMSEVNSDVGACSYALGESFTIYGDLVGHRLTSSDAAEAPRLLGDDQTACSYANESIYELSNIEVPGSAAGKNLGQLVDTVSLWATSDALRAIEEIQALDTDPSNATALRDLSQAEQMLTSDRAQAESELEAADKVLHTRLPALHLAQVPAS